MPDALHKRLAARSEKMRIDAKEKTPSQRKSENLKKKLNRREGIESAVQEDCRDCPNHPCGTNLNSCHVISRVNRCPKCGAKVRYRFIEGTTWGGCPSCR